MARLEIAGRTGMGDDLPKRFDRLIRRRYGIVLLSGFDGSGRTTTLNAALTGDPIYSTVYTSDAATGITRLPPWESRAICSLQRWRDPGAAVVRQLQGKDRVGRGAGP